MDIIYHERQHSNFCALAHAPAHAVNAFLQGPVYTINDLIAIAQSLDEQEMSLFIQWQQWQLFNSGGRESTCCLRFATNPIS